MEVFRLNLDGGGTQESTNLQELQTLRAAVGGTIEALTRVFYVVGDDQDTGFNTYDEAEARKQQLQEDTFYVEPLEVLLSPQPEGLN